MSTFRPLYGPTRIRKSFQLAGSTAKTKRYQSSCLSRRLPHYKSEPRVVKISNSGNHGIFEGLGLALKQREVVDKSEHKPGVSWNGLGYQSSNNLIARQKKIIITKRSKKYSGQSKVELENCKEPFRKDEFRFVCHSPVKTALKVYDAGKLIASRKQTEKEFPYIQEGSYGRRMVAEEFGNVLSSLSKRPEGISFNGRQRCGLGSSINERGIQRQMVSGTKKVAYKLQRSIRGLCHYEKVFRQHKEHKSINPVRQSDCSVVYQEPGRHEIGTIVRNHLQNIYASPEIEHNDSGSVFARNTERGCGQLIEGQAAARLASSTVYNGQNISEVGSSSNRPLRNKYIKSGTKLCIKGCKRLRSNIHKRLQQGMVISPGVDIPATQSDSQSASSFEYSQGCIHSNCAKLGQSVLENRVEGASDGGTMEAQKSESTTSGCPVSEVVASGAEFKFGSLEGTGWADLLADWSEDDKALLSKSWRKSSLKTYASPWKDWLAWCAEKKVEGKNAEPALVAKYLSFLYHTKKYAPSTIRLHKSVIATMSNPLKADLISNNPLVKRLLKAVEMSKPMVNRKYIWDINKLIGWIRTDRVDLNSVFQVSRRLALILLLASGRRIHDLTLLRINEPSMHLDKESVTFWPEFGSKTDKATYRQSGWKLLRSKEKTLDPVFWTEELIKVSSVRRGAKDGLSHLFISSRGKVGPASRTVIAGWIKTVFKSANIEYPPGSIRSAVSSSRFQNHVPLDDILQNANWKGKTNFFKFYFKEIERCSNSGDNKSNDITFVPV